MDEDEDEFDVVLVDLNASTLDDCLSPYRGVGHRHRRADHRLQDGEGPAMLMTPRRPQRERAGTCGEGGEEGMRDLLPM